MFANLVRSIILVSLALPFVQAQTQAPSQDQPAIFRTGVDLILAPVVVRDREGHAVGGLRQDNFQLFDNGKLQPIAKFSIEKSEGGFAPNISATASTSRASAIPARFLAFLFDDIHAKFEELARSRNAVSHFLASSLLDTDRVGIYTISGQAIIEFTDDRDRLAETLKLLAPRSESPSGLNGGDLRPIDDMVRRMAAAPGQRTLILVSPGFRLAPGQYLELSRIMDRAVGANIVINTFDARGLSTTPGFGASSKGNGSGAVSMGRYSREGGSDTSQMLVMKSLAYGTGGSFFQNSNDYDGGIRQAAAAPEFLYVLGFSPQNLKPDGSFHELKVVIKDMPGATATTRHGYYAPKKTEDRAATAKREMEEALFSRDERSEFPLELHTRLAKAGDASNLSILAFIDIKPLPFRQKSGVNRNTVTVLSGIFDQNGTYVTGLQKTIDLSLGNEKFDKVRASGVLVKTDYQIKPGTYRIRIVVRDSEGQMMSTRSGSVEIP